MSVSSDGRAIGEAVVIALPPFKLEDGQVTVRLSWSSRTWDSIATFALQIDSAGKRIDNVNTFSLHY
jgi:hypothetical protein